MSDEAEPSIAKPSPARPGSSRRRVDAPQATTGASSIDRAEKALRLSGDGASLHYDKLLLATGAAPRRLPLAPSSRRCLYLRTFDDALEIRAASQGTGAAWRSIGGGFIGLELAASARLLGCAVTVIEAQPRILMRGVPAEIAARASRPRARAAGRCAALRPRHRGDRG